MTVTDTAETPRMTQTIVVDLPATAWWSANARLHWAARARKTRAVRLLTRAAARGVEVMNAARASVVVHYPTRSRADPHNVASTVVKAAIDGVVDAGALPDDDDTHLTAVQISRGPTTGRRGIYRLTITLEEQGR